MSNKREKFEILLKKDFVLLDGAMGTMIEALGGDMSKIHPIHSPDLIEKIHRMYIKEGADLIYASSFNANGYKLKGSGHSVEEAVKSAMSLARKAVEAEAGAKTKKRPDESSPQNKEVFVALGLGPIGRMIEPAGDMTFEEAYDYFKEMVLAGRDQADLVLIETLSDLYEAKAAILAIKENSDLPIICTMTFEKDGRTFTGMSIPAMVTTLEALGVDALGANCSLGPKEMDNVVKEICQWATIPVVVKPNAGMPDPESGKYSLRPEEFLLHMKKMMSYGVKFLGGCCGTSPEFIRLLRKEIDNYGGTFKELRPRLSTLATGLNVLVIDEPKIVGERINPSGKKDLKEALKRGDLEFVLAKGVEQNEEGASILDVNLGIPEINEAEIMVKLVKGLQKVADLPLQIDSTDPEVIEAGLRAYNGKALVNSVNGEEKSLSSILPLVKKYGAAVIGLTLDERGIPKTAEERFEIAKRIMGRALSFGIKKEDIYIDCLTLTASSEQERVKETLKALRRVKEELGLKTVLGVSNISFGLPERELINRSFLLMALEEGLDLPIMNTGDGEMMDAFRAFRVLAGYDRDSLEYINCYKDSRLRKNGGSRQESDLTPARERSLESTLKNAIKKGLAEEASRIARELLKTTEPMDIVKGLLVPALDEVGEDFESGEIFLPQLLLSAGAAQNAFSEIKAFLEENKLAREERGTILLATVKGDIHDIGKNIVKVLLENYDYRIVDLGKDVDSVEILKGIKESGASLVGLSALMTTSLQSMEESIKRIKEEFPQCKIMVGGAVLTEGYSLKIGADYYGADAKKAVDIANNHFAVL